MKFYFENIYSFWLLSLYILYGIYAIYTAGIISGIISLILFMFGVFAIHQFFDNLGELRNRIKYGD